MKQLIAPGVAIINSQYGRRNGGRIRNSPETMSIGPATSGPYGTGYALSVQLINLRDGGTATYQFFLPDVTTNDIVYDALTGFAPDPSSGLTKGEFFNRRMRQVYEILSVITP